MSDVLVRPPFQSADILIERNALATDSFIDQYLADQLDTRRRTSSGAAASAPVWLAFGTRQSTFRGLAAASFCD